MTQLVIQITPADDLIDVPRHIVVTGAAPQGRVTLTATTVRAGGITWRSQATFVADATGRVDVGHDAAVAGDYQGVAAMGLIWSQSPVDSKSREFFGATPVAPLTTTIHAVAGTGTDTGTDTDTDTHGAQAQFVQRLVARGVQRQEVRDQGLVGTLFTPAGPGPHPAVIVLNGSGGGINEPRAALYASRGYAALALGYFKAPGLSDYISNTPLEYFKQGMDWVRTHVLPAHDFVALSGQSRGGELVLLLGATYPEAVSAVVAYVPGAVVHSGQNAADPAVGREGPAWLLGGEPVTHVWQNNRTASWKPFDDGPAPHRHERAILTALQDPDAVARARIKVEAIQGPVMLLSGTDDGSWPSSLYSRMVQDKLSEVAHPYPVQWLDYEEGGHSILFPYVPTTQLVYAHPVSGRISTSGGHPAANARADVESWAGVRQFLDQAVAVRAASPVAPSKH